MYQTSIQSFTFNTVKCNVYIIFNQEKQANNFQDLNACYKENTVIYITF